MHAVAGLPRAAPILGSAASAQELMYRAAHREQMVDALVDSPHVPPQHFRVGRVRTRTPGVADLEEFADVGKAQIHQPRVANEAQPPDVRLAVDAIAARARAASPMR